MRMPSFAVRPALAVLFLAGAGVVASAAGQDPAADLVKQGQGLLREGKHAEALAVFQKAIAAAPGSLQANTQAGVVLDLMGRYGEARTHLGAAVEIAQDVPSKARALRSLAMSYAFERDCAGAVKYAGQAFDLLVAGKDFTGQGEVANELARVCLESGDVDAAFAWYEKGHQAALQQPDLTAAQKDLWEFRWQHAQARIAARRGQAAEAATHVAAARAALDTGTNPEQQPFFPYLTGYVAFYGGDYRRAIADLMTGNQNDPFIQCLIAQTHEKLGDQAQAKAWYGKVLASNAHNPTNAYARPIAKEKLGAK